MSWLLFQHPLTLSRSQWYCVYCIAFLLRALGKPEHREETVPGHMEYMQHMWSSLREAPPWTAALNSQYSPATIYFSFLFILYIQILQSNYRCPVLVLTESKLNKITLNKRFCLFIRSKLYIGHRNTLEQMASSGGHVVIVLLKLLQFN